MKSIFAVILSLLATPAFAGISCAVDVYGKDSQKVMKLHQDVSFAQAAAGENFEYSPLISVLQNLKVSCGRNLALNSVSCSFGDKAGNATSAGSISANNALSDVTVTFEDQKQSIAAGFSNTIVTCVFTN